MHAQADTNACLSTAHATLVPSHTLVLDHINAQEDGGSLYHARSPTTDFKKLTWLLRCVGRIRLSKAHCKEDVNAPVVRYCTATEPTFEKSRSSRECILYFFSFLLSCSVHE